MKNKQTKPTNKRTLCLENCKGFILNYSVAKLKSSCQGLVILVAVLRIIRRKLANSSSCLWVCAGVRMLRGCLSPWGQKEHERPLCSPCPFTGWL